MVDDKKLKHLLNGKSKRLNGDEIIFMIENYPNLGKANYNKLRKAHNSGKGCNFSFEGEHELEGCGLFKSMGRAGKSIGKSVIKSGVGDLLINEGVGMLPISETGRRAVGNAISGTAHHMAGGGFLKSMGRMGKSIGKAAVQSGVGDILIDEGLKRSGMDEGLRNKVGKVAKGVSHDLVGGSINPYLPDSLRGGSIGRNLHVYNDLSNRVHPQSASFMIDARQLPMYDRYKELKGSGFLVH